MEDAKSDPEYTRWKRQYPAFPTVIECERLVLIVKAKGLWIDLIVEGLGERAESIFDELVDYYERNRENRFSLIILMALEIAAIPESVPFLIKVATDGDGDKVRWAKAVLASVDTKESRTALFMINSQKTYTG